MSLSCSWFDRLTNHGSTGSPTVVRLCWGRDFSLAGFFLPCQGIPSQGWRVSACRSILLLQSFKKSMDGFFLWQDFFFLAKEYLAKDGGLARAEAFCFCNHSKNPRRDFFLAGFSLSCQGIPSHGRRVSSMQKHFASAIIQKIHGGIFFLAGFSLPCQGISSQGWRVSACRSILLLQS